MNNCKQTEHFQENSGKFPGIFRKISGKCPGNVRNISRICSGHVQEISGKFPGNFRICSGNVREMSVKFREMSISWTWAFSHLLFYFFLPRVKLWFLVITRDHGSFGGRHQVEILPTDLPELFKPARDLLEPTKTTRTTRTRTTKTTKTPRLFNF